MKLLDYSEALAIFDHLEKHNLLHAESRVLAEIVREERFNRPAPEEAHLDGVFRNCMTEADGNFDGYVWDFDKIMSYIQIAFSSQLAEVTL